ncbi:MAG: hypothetical protein OEY33_02305 [Bdellovibrionales bacterium]|jgi:hypothetical protein|nr:hypothetical protein [Bdellovibrionales bacterium]
MDVSQLSMDISFCAKGLSIFQLEEGIVRLSDNENSEQSLNLLLRSDREDYFWKAVFWNNFYQSISHRNPVLIWTQKKISKSHFLKWLNYCQRRKHLPRNFTSVISFEYVEDKIELKNVFRSFIDRAILDYGYNPQYYISIYSESLIDQSEILEELALDYCDFNYQMISPKGTELSHGRDFPIRKTCPGNHIYNQLRLL